MARSVDAARWLAEQPRARVRDAAARFGVSYQAVQSAWSRIFGPAPKPRAAVDQATTKLVLDIAAAEPGMSIRQIAKVACVSKTKAGRIIREHKEHTNG